MLSSPINLGTPITTLESGSSSLELVNIGDVVVSLGDYFFFFFLVNLAKRLKKEILKGKWLKKLQ